MVMSSALIRMTAKRRATHSLSMSDNTAAHSQQRGCGSIQLSTRYNTAASGKSLLLTLDKEATILSQPPTTGKWRSNRPVKKQNVDQMKGAYFLGRGSRHTRKYNAARPRAYLPRVVGSAELRLPRDCEIWGEVRLMTSPACSAAKLPLRTNTSGCTPLRFRNRSASDSPDCNPPSLSQSNESL